MFFTAPSISTNPYPLAAFLSPPIMEVAWRQPTNDAAQLEITEARQIAEGVVGLLTGPTGPVHRTAWMPNLTGRGRSIQEQEVLLNCDVIPDSVRHYRDLAVQAQQGQTAHQDPLLKSSLQMTALLALRLLDARRDQRGPIKLATVYRVPSPNRPRAAQGILRDEIRWNVATGHELVAVMIPFSGLYLQGLVDISTLVAIGPTPNDPAVMSHPPHQVGIGVVGSLRLYAQPLFIGTMNGGTGFIEVDRRLGFGMVSGQTSRSKASRLTGRVRLEVADKTIYFAGDSWD